MSDGRIVIDTDIDSSGLESGLGKLKGIVTKGAATLGIAKMAKDVVGVGKSFEAGMSEVQAISGASGKDLKALTDKAKEMGATTKFSATQSAEAMKYMAMAGWKTKDMVSGLGGVMNLAAASGEDLGTVSDIVTDALTAFGLKAQDSGHFADVLAKASSNSNTNVSMMGETFKYVAPLAGAMKYSVEDTATAIGLLANAGIKGSQAGTSLRSMMTRMVKPSKETAKAMKELGLEVVNSDGSMKPLRQTMTELRQKFSGLSESQKSSKAASIAGQEAMSGLLAIVNASDEDFNKLTKAIDNSSGAAKKQADTMNQNLQGALYELGSAAEAVGIELYSHIKKPLTKVVMAGATQVRGLASVVKKNKIKNLVDPSTVETVKALGNVAKTVGGAGLKVLGATAKVAGGGVKILADNLDKAIPLAAGLAAAVGGYKAYQQATVAVQALSGAYKTLTAMEKANAITLVASQGGLTGLQTVVGIFTGKVSLATAATGAFNTVCAALGGPVGLAVLGVTALGGAMLAHSILTVNASKKEDAMVEKIKASTKARKEYTKSLQDSKKQRAEDIQDANWQGAQADGLASKLRALMAVEKKSAGQKAQIKTIVQQLNEIYPDLNLKYDQEKDKLNKSTAAIEKNIEAQKQLALAKAYGAQMADVAKEQVQTESKLAKATDERAEAKKRLSEADKLVADAEKHGKIDPTTGQNTDLVKALSEQNKASQAFTAADENVRKYKQSLSELGQEFDLLGQKQVSETNYATFLQNIDKICAEAKIKAKDVPESVKAGIKEGAYTNPASGDELKSLIKLDGLMQEAKSQGVKVPAAVSQGIQAGKYALPKSVAQMKALVKFNDLSNKSFKSGVKIPQSLQRGIASGKTKPSAAVKQMNALIKFDELVNKSGKAGNKSVQAIVKAVNSGKMKPAQAIKQMNALLEKEAGNGGKKSGSKSGNEMAKSIQSKSGKVKSASTKVVKEAASSAKGSASSSFRPVGTNIASGIASGIISNSSVVSEAARRAVKKGKDAAKDEADIGSPSKVFADEVGHWLPAGIAVGIDKNTKSATDASRRMSAACLTASQKELDICSPSKKFRDAVGKNIPRGVASGVKTAKRELIGEMQTAMKETLKTAEAMAKSGKYSEVGSNLMSNLSDSLSTAKTRASDKVQSAIDSQVNAVQSANDKKEEALQKKIDKTKNKNTKKRLKKQLAAMKNAHTKEENKLSKAGEKVANAFNSAFEKESNRLTDIAQKKLQELPETYQKKYDEIISLRDSLTDKQQSYGNVYDLAQNIADIERYQADLKALENKIPKSMMERILGMNVDEATAYMDWFRGMTKEQQGAYVKNWKKQQSMSEIFSKSFFADDLEKVQTEYTTKIKAATKDFENQMNNVGKNIAKGLSAGITSETRSAEKAMKKLCYSMIKTAKKSLGIHSPSREFSKIGVRDIEGLEVGHEKKAKSLYRQMDSLSGTMAQRFANAKLNVPDITARLQSAVDKQAQAIMARMQPVVNQQLVQSQQTPANHFPENITISIPINGREVAKETFPFMDLLLGEAAARKMRGGV